MEEEVPSVTRDSFARPAQTGLTTAALQTLLAEVAAQQGGSAQAAAGFMPTTAAMNPVSLFSQLLANPGQQLAQLSALHAANVAQMQAAPGHAQYLQQHVLHSQSVPASQQQQQGAASNNYASRHQQVGLAQTFNQAREPLGTAIWASLTSLASARA